MLKLTPLLLLAAPACAADPIQLSFLTGCWSMTRNGAVIEEMWNKPAAGVLMGMGRTVSATGKLVESEFVQIREENGVLAYVVQLKLGGPLTVFPAVKVSSTEVVFSNPEHDFPSRIVYRMQPDGNLFARIEGRVNGKDAAQDFPYTRAQCE